MERTGEKVIYFGENQGRIFKRSVPLSTEKSENRSMNPFFFARLNQFLGCFTNRRSQENKIWLDESLSGGRLALCSCMHLTGKDF